MKYWAMVMCASTLWGISAVSGAPFAGEDFDGGTTNGGFSATAATYTPDNTAFNGLFGFGGSRFDRFGIANVTVEDTEGSEGLPFQVVDESLVGFPGDSSGIISENKTDNFFIITDVENSANDNMTTASASWDFDVTGQQQLAVSIDMTAIGDFGSDGRGILDRFNFQWSIDGGEKQPLMNVASLDDGSGYSVTMADGNSYNNSGGNFFFDEDEFNLLGCVAGTANSCSATDVAGPDGPVRVDASDTNKDGSIYANPITGTIGDTPTDPNDPSVDQVRVYEETNDFGTFSNPELNLFRNGLVVNGDAGRAVTNQLQTITESISGTGSTLTLSLDVEQVGGDQWFAFDNIVIDGTTGGGGLACDFDSDGDCEADDMDALYASGDVALTEINDWLAAASDSSNTYLGGTKTFVMGDVDLDGLVDSNDLGRLLNNFGNSASASFGSGNLNDDTMVDSSDLGLLLNNFGFSSASAAAVPEPNTVSLLLLALVGLGAFARRQR